MPELQLSTKGQVVIPKEMRDALGLVRGATLQADLVDGTIRLKPVERGARDWRRWRGALKGTGALEAQMKEHRDEVANDRVGG